MGAGCPWVRSAEWKGEKQAVNLEEKIKELLFAMAKIDCPSLNCLQASFSSAKQIVV